MKNKTINNNSKPFDFILFINVLVLLGMGVTMVLSASSPMSLATTSSSYTFASKQAIAAVLGIFVMLVVSKIDYRIYSKFYKIIWIISIVRLSSSFSTWCWYYCKRSNKVD